MNFTEIALNRQSCRSYDSTREVEYEKINAILNAARLAPSACNGQPYHITVCKNGTAKGISTAATATLTSTAMAYIVATRLRTAS